MSRGSPDGCYFPQGVTSLITASASPAGPSRLPGIGVTVRAHWDIVSNLEVWCPHKRQEWVSDPTVHSQTRPREGAVLSTQLQEQGR